MTDNIVFIRPNNPETLVIIPPLNIGYLADAARQVGHVDKIAFIDALLHHMSPQETADELAKSEWDYVAITCMTSDMPWVVSLCNIIAGKYTIILGGAHPTVMPDETMKETNADYVVVGEGELALKTILYEMDKPGVVVANSVNPDEFNVDWNIINPLRYPHQPWGGSSKNSMVAPIITSRGCPYECTFCASPKLCGRKIRYRKPENVIKELIYLNKEFGIKEFNFQDDNFTANAQHARAICEGIIKAGLKIDWACENGIRADRVDRDLVQLMKRAGCYRVTFGVESPNNSILANVRKRETVEDIEKGIALAADAGIETRGSFILGLPGETKETLRNTVRWARKSRLTEANFNILTILPGSELWDKYGKEHDGNFLYFRSVDYVPDGLTAKDLTSAQRKAFWLFYSKPGRFFRTLFRLRLSQVKSLVKRVLGYNIV